MGIRCINEGYGKTEIKPWLEIANGSITAILPVTDAISLLDGDEKKNEKPAPN